MLLGAGRRRILDYDNPRDSIHNYYEQLVIDQITRAVDQAVADPELFADIACVALNHLPPRYVRHDVDMTFFLSPTELEEMHDKVAKAVNMATDHVLRSDAVKREHKKDEDKTDKDS